MSLWAVVVSQPDEGDGGPSTAACDREDGRWKGAAEGMTVAVQSLGRRGNGAEGETSSTGARVDHQASLAARLSFEAPSPFPTAPKLAPAIVAPSFVSSDASSEMTWEASSPSPVPEQVSWLLLNSVLFQGLWEG